MSTHNGAVIVYTDQMKSDKLAELYKTQKSLTEWLQDINHSDAEAIRNEDNEKRERLKTLKNHLGLPFDEPAQFEATDLKNKTPKLEKYLKEHGSELCALRIIPKQPNLPKLRMRGKSVQQAYEWFLEQDLDASAYRADYMPHSDSSEWATIFIVNKNGIQGEIIWGGHYQLTQGFFEKSTPIIFKYDFKKWELSEPNADAQKHLEEIAAFLKVTDQKVRDALSKELQATFVDDYLAGYFETVNTKEFGLWFVDYSRLLGELFQDAQFSAKTADNKQAVVSGQVGCEGRAEGEVRIVAPDGLDADFPDGAVLVCPVTTPEYIPLMQKASAIVTDQGGILSHAAIVARELKKPCVVGTGEATAKLSNGQRIIVDATNGQILLP